MAIIHTHPFGVHTVGFGRLLATEMANARTDTTMLMTWGKGWPVQKE